MGYRLTQKARDDLVALYLNGIQEFGTHQADQYHEGLKVTFQFLSDNPEAARPRLELSPLLRVHPYKSHIILYDITPQRDVIIVRVRHKREDWLIH